MATKPKPKAGNAFDIPSKSVFIDADRKRFSRTYKANTEHLTPLVLPGSSKFPRPGRM